MSAGNTITKAPRHAGYDADDKTRKEGTINLKSKPLCAVHKIMGAHCTVVHFISVLQHVVQRSSGREVLARAKRAAKEAAVRHAQVVACTLSSAGGELETLCGSSKPFSTIIVDEVLVS